MRVAAIVISVLMPILAIAQAINPFKPTRMKQPAASVLTPPLISPFTIPPPLPQVERRGAVMSEPGVHQLPIVAPIPPSEPSCRIEVAPRAPRIGAEGGHLVLRIDEGAHRQGCVAGIESRDKWLKIRHFNGRELTLYVERNEGHQVRSGELILANTVDSIIVNVVQAAP